MSEQRAWHHSAHSLRIHRFGRNLGFDSVVKKHEEQMSPKVAAAKDMNAAFDNLRGQSKANRPVEL